LSAVGKQGPRSWWKGALTGLAAFSPYWLLEAIAVNLGGWAGGARTALVGAIVGFFVALLLLLAYLLVMRRRAA
jgi:hypothetical protein